MVPLPAPLSFARLPPFRISPDLSQPPPPRLCSAWGSAPCQELLNPAERHNYLSLGKRRKVRV